MKMASSPTAAASQGRRLSSFAAAMGFGISGIAFTLGSLMLARQLPMDAYGRLTLAIALFNILGLMVPLGLDQLLLRRQVAVNGKLLALLLASGLGISALLFGVMYRVGGLRPPEIVLTGVAIVAGGVVATSSIGLRMSGKPSSSMALAISASFVLLLAGILGMALDIVGTIMPLSVFAAGNCLFAAAGWAMLSRTRGGMAELSDPISWPEALPMLGLVALNTLSLQIERIIIPIPLTLEDLATFGVLASVAIFPFRLLAAGVGFSLPPKLIATATIAERKGVVAREIRQMILIFLPASLLLVLLAPWAAALLTGGLYVLDRMLVFAACLNGAAKVAMAFPAAMLKVCGSAADLMLINIWGMLWLALTICGAMAGARFGLAGLILGASLASIVPTFFSFNLAWSRIGRG